MCYNILENESICKEIIFKYFNLLINDKVIGTKITLAKLINQVYQKKVNKNCNKNY